MTDVAVTWLGMAFAARDGGESVGRGDQRLAGGYACYRVYACKNGGYFSVAALEPKFWRALCNALERPDLVELQYSEDAATQTAVEEIFASQTRREWQEKLGPREARGEAALRAGDSRDPPRGAARGRFSG